MSDLELLLERVVREVDMGNNPYLRHLDDGSLGAEEVFETQLQFHAAVVHFGRPLAWLGARIDDLGLRTGVMRNVWEEHGEGEAPRTHHATFVLLLSRLGRMEPGAVEILLAQRPVWPEVHAFNVLLSGVAAQEDPLCGAATLGMIEHTFATVSGRIGRGLVERGLVGAEEMVHYDLHEVLDVTHAEDLFAVCRAGRGPLAWDAVERGVWLGATAFSRLYEDLDRHRSRRWRRP